MRGYPNRPMLVFNKYLIISFLSQCGKSWSGDKFVQNIYFKPITEKLFQSINVGFQ